MKLYDSPMSGEFVDVQCLLNNIDYMTRKSARMRQAGEDMYRLSSRLFDAEIKEAEIPEARRAIPAGNLMRYRLEVTPPVSMSTDQAPMLFILDHGSTINDLIANEGLHYDEDE